MRWTIDDIDPYRTFGAPEPPRRLDPDEYAHWCEQLDEAWANLVAEHPDHVPEVVALRVVEPARFAAAAAEPGERELAQGDHAAAATAFADRLRVNADDDAAWVGLLLATRADEVPPEVLSATYRHLAVVSDTPPDPVALMDWFAAR